MSLSSSYERNIRSTVGEKNPRGLSESRGGKYVETHLTRGMPRPEYFQEDIKRCACFFNGSNSWFNDSKKKIPKTTLVLGYLRERDGSDLEISNDLSAHLSPTLDCGKWLFTLIVCAGVESVFVGDDDYSANSHPTSAGENKELDFGTETSFCDVDLTTTRLLGLVN
ncbi:hypothetical protein CDAR_274201 [Caerostris darwini]|uniref:Uncharacterized protein n=1 Tax=Caerostris darwini TaxID=1538125 RepID=A0AAV4RF31_9ARAC|nr:hypothetical protein CDAR_274201 [Caerostris darwini]